MVSRREIALLVDQAGESGSPVASRFSVTKWSQRHRATGSVAPAKTGGGRESVLEPHRGFIIERIEQTPHLTLHGRTNKLAARGVKVSHNAVWLFLRHEGLRFKKHSGGESADRGAGRKYHRREQRPFSKAQASRDAVERGCGDGAVRAADLRPLGRRGSSHLAARRRAADHHRRPAR
jgi:putative transposase